MGPTRAQDPWTIADRAGDVRPDRIAVRDAVSLQRLALVAVIVVLSAFTAWLISPRFAIDSPSLVDDWSAIAKAPDQVRELIRLENSFAEHMRTNPFSSWGSVEMANDAMENAVDRLYEEIEPRLVPALREMGATALASSSAPEPAM